MTKTNTEAVGALAHGLWAVMRHKLGKPPSYLPKSRTDFRDEAKKRLTALSPTDKTEPSAAGLDRALWLVNVVEGNVRTSNPKYADQLQEVWSILWDALSAPTREREMRETLSPVREALEQGAKWFEEYADHHAQLAKAAGFNVGKERDAKAERNRERASTLWEAVIAFDLAFKDQASE